MPGGRSESDSLEHGSESGSVPVQVVYGETGAGGPGARARTHNRDQKHPHGLEFDCGGPALIRSEPGPVIGSSPASQAAQAQGQACSGCSIHPQRGSAVCASGFLCCSHQVCCVAAIRYAGLQPSGLPCCRYQVLCVAAIELSVLQPDAALLGSTRERTQKDGSAEPAGLS